MSNNKQTAVDYLVEQLFAKALSAEQYYHIEQAKAMHKEEIISDYLQGANDEAIERNARERFLIKKDAIRYYNETYGGNNEQQ